MRKVLLIAAVLALAGCAVPPNKANNALEAMGMTDIELGGYSFFGCSDSDTFSSKFTATSSNGQRVSGVLCSAPFKGVTVRF